MTPFLLTLEPPLTALEQQIFLAGCFFAFIFFQLFFRRLFILVVVGSCCTRGMYCGLHLSLQELIHHEVMEAIHSDTKRIMDSKSAVQCKKRHHARSLSRVNRMA